MALADLFNVPNSDEEMAKWSFIHMAHHRDLNSAIYAKYGDVLPEYAIDPIDLSDPGSFLDLHQQMHNNNDAITGISGYNLSEVDFNDKSKLAAWIYLNATLHVAEAGALGVS